MLTRAISSGSSTMGEVFSRVRAISIASILLRMRLSSDGLERLLWSLSRQKLSRSCPKLRKSPPDSLIFLSVSNPAFMFC